MGTRQAQLKSWAKQVWPYAERDAVEITPVSGDASFRRYFRLADGQRALIGVDAPPDKENSEPFVRIATEWFAKGIRVPQVIADDLELGFMLLEDFADQQLLPILEQDASDTPYQQALQSLVGIQMLPAVGLPPYDSAVLTREMELFPEWFLGSLLGMSDEQIATQWRPLLDKTYELLIQSALIQPQVCVHRDYHSRNLMPLADGGLGIIDFQDALIGPITYDLVSLLRDSYIDWSDEQVADWVESYRMQLLDTGFALPSDSEFLKQFDLMGMQRQLKVVGIFSRLWLRDGKEGYLKDIPRTFGYLLNAAKKYPEFAELRQALEALIPSMKANEDLNRYPLAPWVTQ